MMQDKQDLRSELIHILCDGQFHSGEALARRFSVSRTAIAKHVSALIELGLDIYSVKGKGYALSDPIVLLESSVIKDFLPADIDVPITLLPVTDSTNTFLKERVDSAVHGEVVIAEAQTAGRGRRGKSWVSPFGASLYLSMCWRFQGGYQQIGGLSLYVGYCVIQALQAFGIDGLGVKWPNDIYRYGEKLGGILVEVEGQIGTEVSCIIGVGINVRLPDVGDSITQAYTDLSDTHIDRNALSAAIIEFLHQGIPGFEIRGLQDIVANWNALDVFAKQNVTILGSESKIEGVNLGINDAGALQLQTPEGLKLIHGGEVSLRAR